MRINYLFNQAKQEKTKLFIPYITCGDPNLSVTFELVKKLVDVGADVIELGIPFSDPLADGPTNQLSVMRALKNNVSLTDCCILIKDLRNEGCTIPIILFTYFNPILKLGVEKFVEYARDAKIDAVLVVDLPIEEAQVFRNLLVDNDIGTVFLITPATSIDRINISNQLATEFLYYVSRTGVTGIQPELEKSWDEKLIQLKQHTQLPVAIGFGISTPEQAARAALFADGVIVGSALVKHLENPNLKEGVANLLALAKEMNVVVKHP